MSDHQFKSFRDGIPSLAALFALSIGINRIFGIKGRFVGSLLFIGILHGFKAIEPIAILSLNYFLLKHLKQQYIVPFTWIYALLTLCLLETDLFRFKWSIWNGFLSLWTVVFKISILRVISFNLDYHKNKNGTIITDCCNDEIISACHKCRVKKSAADFSFKSYLMYVFYPPLYLSGPILTFNDFHHQVQLKNHHKPIFTQINVVYGLRLLFSMLTLEVILHLFHVCAIKSSSAWNVGFTPLAFAGVAFLNLKVIWLKLLVIWRFSRFFALCDGIEAPENMIRCMSNNYSTLKFWRSWHRSFNLWVLRYLYIPLGGRKTSNWNIFPIFAFIALWHDFNWQLLAWGCLVPLIILPEVLANWISKRLQMNKWTNYRSICAAMASLNIFLLMVCNLVGFSVGIDGARIMLNQIVGKGGFWFVGTVLLVFYAAANLMFEIREEEFRRTGKYSTM